METYLSIDVGTTATKCFIYSNTEILHSSQVKNSFILPQDG